MDQWRGFQKWLLPTYPRMPCMSCRVYKPRACMDDGVTNACSQNGKLIISWLSSYFWLLFNAAPHGLEQIVLSFCHVVVFCWCVNWLQGTLWNWLILMVPLLFPRFPEMWMSRTGSCLKAFEPSSGWLCARSCWWCTSGAQAYFRAFLWAAKLIILLTTVKCIMCIDLELNVSWIRGWKSIVAPGLWISWVLSVIFFFHFADLITRMHCWSASCEIERLFDSTHWCCFV